MMLRNGQMAVFVEEKLDERDTFKVIRLSVIEASQALTQPVGRVHSKVCTLTTANPEGNRQKGNLIPVNQIVFFLSN